jgi:hypothetical protein
MTLDDRHDRALRHEDHEFYAGWLERGSHASMAITVVCFAAYVTGIWLPQLGIQDLIAQWSLPVDQFLARTGGHRGWSWLTRLDRSDMACLGGMALLAGCSAPAMLALLMRYWRRGERLAFGMVLAQLAVLGLAAAGVVGQH